MSEVDAENRIFARAYIRYPIAVVAVVASLLLRQGLVQLLGHELPTFILFYPAIMVVALLCGIWPGVLATVLAALLADYWLMAPIGSFAIANAADAVALALFVSMGVFMSLLAERHRRYEARIAAYKREQALWESEERFRLIVENVKDCALFMLDPEGRVATWNTGAQRMKGYKADEILGQHFSRFYTPEDIATGKPQRELAIAAEKGEYSEEGWRVRQDGSRFQAGVTITAVRDAAGQHRGFAKITRDITERKQKEEQLQKLNRTLKALSNSNHALLHATSELEFLQQVCSIVNEDCGHAMVWIGIAENDADKTVLPVAHAGFEDGYLETLRITWSESERGCGPTGTAIRTGQPSMCRNMLIDSEFRPWREEAIKRGYAASLAVPIIEGDKAFGAITIYSRVPDAFSEGEARLLTELTADISYGISTLHLRAAHAQAEEALRSSQSKLQSIVNSAMDAVISIDEQQRIVMFNRAAETIFQCAASEAVGSALDRFIPEALHEVHREHIRRFGSEGSTTRSMSAPAILNAVRAGGEEFPIEATISQVQADGEKLYTVILRDITGRKRAGEALARAHEQTEADRRRLEAILQTIPVGVVLIDHATNRFSLINRRAAEIYGADYDGFDLDENIARVKLLQPDGTRFALEDLPVSHAWLGEESHNVEMTIERADGVRVPLIVNTAPLRDAEGQVITAIVVFDDITERKQAENALRESQAQFCTLADAIPQLCWIANADGWIFWYNQRWYGYTGTTPEQMEGWGWQSVHDPEALPKVLKQWKVSIATGEPFDMVFPLRGADGVFRPFLTRIMPVKDEEGKVVRWFGTNTDISAQKQAEEELQLSKQRLQIAVELADLGQWDLDLNSHAVFRSLRHDQIFGYESALPGWTYEMFLDHVLPEHRADVDEKFKASLAAGTWDFETRIRRADGEVRWIWARGRIQRDEAGQPAQVFGTVADITERKRVEQEREASVEFLRRVNDSTGTRDMVSAAAAFWQEQSGCEAVGIRLHDGDDYPYYEARGFPKEFVLLENSLCVRNEAGEVLRNSSGYPIHECMCGNVICGRLDPSKPFFTAGGSFWTNNTTQLLASTTAAERQNRTRNRCNGEGYESVALIPLLVGQEHLGLLQLNDRRAGMFSAETIALWERLAGYLAVALAKSRAQEALRSSEERWATTLRSIGDAVISTDENGNIVFMNDVAQKLTGWTLPEAKGKDLDIVFNIVQEVTRIKPESPVSKVIRLGKVIGLANHTALIRRDGTEIPIEDSGAPIRNQEGETEGVVLVFHDVSEQKKIEKALRSSERLATTGRLAATIAHEIHNPLDAVGNLLYLIDQEASEKNIKDYSSLATNELQRVTKMTQQMLSFQRDAAKPVPVRIGDVLDSVLALYERKIESAGIKVETQVDGTDEILALPGELRQVFANLIGNAIEATRSAKGKIILRASSSREWKNGRTGVRVVVADNGSGIPAQIRNNIFEPFFTTKGEGGTGLGLWITTDIIRKYNGTLRLWSSARPGRSGTCFSVFLPFGTPSALDDGSELGEGSAQRVQ